MPEIKKVVEEEVVAEESDEEFESGFEDKPTAEAKLPAEEAPSEKTDATLEKSEAVDAPAEVTYHQLTDAQWQDLQALSTQVETIRAYSTRRIDQAFGKVGE